MNISVGVSVSPASAALPRVNAHMHLRSLTHDIGDLPMNVYLANMIKRVHDVDCYQECQTAVQLHEHFRLVAKYSKDSMPKIA